MSINCSASNIAFFTYERYKAVCKPVETRQNLDQQSIRRQITIIWVFNLIWNSPWFFLTTLKRDSTTLLPTCSFKLERKKYLLLFFLDLVLFYIIPLFFSAYNYVKIYQNLSKRFTFSESSTPTTNNQPTITLDSSNNRNEHTGSENFSIIGETSDCITDHNENFNFDWNRQTRNKRSRTGSYCFGEMSRDNSFNHKENTLPRASINISSPIFKKKSIKTGNLNANNLRENLSLRNSITPSTDRRLKDIKRQTTDQQNRQVKLILFFVFPNSSKCFSIFSGHQNPFFGFHSFCDSSLSLSNIIR